MRSKIFTAMGYIILVGMITAGPFGIAIGVFISALVGVVYGLKKSDKQVVVWSCVALAIDIMCAVAFAIGLSNM